MSVAHLFSSAAEVQFKYDNLSINDSCLGSKLLNNVRRQVLGFYKPNFPRLILQASWRRVKFVSLNKYFLVVVVFGFFRRKEHFQERQKKVCLKLGMNIPHIAILVTAVTVAKCNLIFAQESQRRTILFNATYKTIVWDIF